MKKITQQQIGTVLGISQSGVSKKFAHGTLRQSEMKKVSKTLKVPYVAFFDEAKHNHYFSFSYANNNTKPTTNASTTTK